MLNGKCVFISSESRESNGRVYHNVNLEMEEGNLIRVGVDEMTLSKMQKYKEYLGYFEVKMWNRELNLHLVDVQVPTASGK